ncbi:LOW QUALITY PROTEIN: DIMBOA UDP-glucosyltransferase BX8-like [Curcuma longa]|uniref:LOW QUALITY PROTEIN: DIMBOA UDP-glucosyltransferase BX8-like n=1 Tax=Curcuma longa TaxID=136217 RepID=UPI003D9E2315
MGEPARPRVGLFPCPFQGHLNPMFQLAHLLHRLGFPITVFLPPSIPDSVAGRIPHFDVVPLPGRVLPRLDNQTDVAAAIAALNAQCEAPFREALCRIASAEGVACVIVDALLFRVQEAAKDAGVPALVLRSSSAACFNAFILYPLLLSRGYHSIQQESHLEDPIPELPPLRVKDLVRAERTSSESLSRMLEQVVGAARTSSGIIFNTFDAVEAAELELLRRRLDGVPVFAVGPLSAVTGGAQCSLLAQDRRCMEWLDKQADRSVLYVSFGSLAVLEEEEFGEIAQGLAQSGQPFLWVVRPGQVRAGVGLPHDLMEVEERWMIVDWAPQQDVLGHPAVGGFWTHTGWNSTVESLAAGVPMLCSPRDYDQMGNARYVAHVWKVGLQIEFDNGPNREEISQAVRRLMVDEAGNDARARAKHTKDEVTDCVQPGGSSSRAIESLVDHICSL